MIARGLCVDHRGPRDARSSRGREDSGKEAAEEQRGAAQVSGDRQHVEKCHDEATPSPIWVKHDQRQRHRDRAQTAPPPRRAERPHRDHRDERADDQRESRWKT